MIPFLYALVTSAGTIVGGVFALHTRIRLIEQRYMVGFAAGATVAIALFNFIPEMKAHNAIALLLGFFVIYLLEKVILVHSCVEEDCETHTIGSTALIGIAAESLLDGLAIATGFRVDSTLGFMIALAVFIHEIPRGITTAVIMKQSGYSQVKIWGALAIDAGFTPLGVLLSGVVPASWFDPLIGFTAGVFLYIGASDLLPEAHRRFNLRVVFSTLLGAVAVPAFTLFLK